MISCGGEQGKGKVGRQVFLMGGRGHPSVYQGGLCGAALGEAQVRLTVRKGFMRPVLLRRTDQGQPGGLMTLFPETCV